MNAAKAVRDDTTTKRLPKTEKSRVSSLPLSEFLRVRIEESGKRTIEIANALGYKQPNVISMMKTGSMRLPLNKVGSMAKVIGVDPVFLLEKVLSESNPEIWDALKQVIGVRLVTANEMALLEVIRGVMNGTDPNYLAYKDMIDTLLPQLEKIQARELATAQATLDAISRSKVRTM